MKHTFAEIFNIKWKIKFLFFYSVAYVIIDLSMQGVPNTCSYSHTPICVVEGLHTSIVEMTIHAVVQIHKM